MSNEDQSEPRFYEKQADGSLTPVKVPGWAIERAEAYRWLRGQGLTDEGVQFIWVNAPPLG